MIAIDSFVPAIFNQLVWTCGFIFLAAIGAGVFDTAQKIKRRWGFIGFKPQYALSYLRRFQTI